MSLDTNELEAERDELQESKDAHLESIGSSMPEADLDDDEHRAAQGAR